MKIIERATAMLVALVIIGGAGCGKSTTTQTGAPATAPTATTIAQAEQNALPLTVAAVVPATLKCSDAIVWVNLHRRTYHESGDPYYGRTKNGQYMCLADATAKGYRKAGTMHARKRGPHAPGAVPAMQPTPTPY